MYKIRESMLAVYEAKTEMKQEDIIPLLDSENWMTAQDALNNGFCDEIEEEKQVAASLSGDFLNINGVNMNLKKFKKAPALAFLPKALEENKEKDKPNNKSKIEYIKAKLALECEL